VNMADGQNGIVPGMFVVWSVCLLLVGDANVKPLVEVLCGVSLVVLMFNLRGTLFLGDCGTYGVTFVLGLATMFVYATGKVSIETIAVWFFVPVVDCLRLLITRPLRGRSPMQADHDHFHHRLQEEFGPRYGLVAYVGVVALSSVTAALEPHLALVCIVILTAFYSSFSSLAESAIGIGVDATGTGAEPGDTDPSNVIPLAPPEAALRRGHIRHS
jgi:UDP-GlcNAc:undecaprenyl-phosphate GlcNAc-1-phosphate transferase